MTSFLAEPFSGTETSNVVLASSSPVEVLAASFTLGAWTPVLDPTPSDWGGFYIAATPPNWGYMQVGIAPTGSAADSEAAIAELPARFGIRNNSYPDYFFPIGVPAGSRVSVRISSDVAVAGASPVQVIGVPRSRHGMTPLYSSSTLLGFEKAGANGTHGHGITVDPGAVANTKGAWTEIVAALPDDYAGVQILFDDKRNSAQLTHDRLWDFAVGPAAGEVLVAENVWQHIAQTEWGVFKDLVLGWSIPAGTRFAARMQASTIDASDRIGSVCLIGFK